jgi:hypothetical protein
MALNPYLLLLGLGIGLVEAIFIFQAVKNTRRHRLLARLPWTELGQLQAGLVKVQGQVIKIGELLRSPLSGRECVYFRFKVQEKRHRGGMPPHGGGGSYWKTVINDVQGLPFALDDGTGAAAVRLKSAELDLNSDVTENSGFLNSARPELEETLRLRYRYSSVGLIFNRTLYYTEARIEEGDSLVLLATAQQRPGGWELVRGRGPMLVSANGPTSLQAKYRNGAILWWFLAVVLPVAVGFVVIGIKK